MLHLRPRTAAAAAIVLSMLVGPAVTPASAQDPGARPDTSAEAAPLQPTTRREGSKAPSSRLAESDAALLKRSDAARVPVLIKLDYDSIATYRGGSDGAPATSPSATGRPLTRAAATGSTYARQVAAREAAIVADIRSAVPQATIGRSLRVVFGGVAAVVPANRADDLLGVDGVTAVQLDEKRELLTDSSTEFIDAPPVWSTQGGQALAGQGVLYGSLDSGIWPEHPSFADNPALGPAPTDTNGDPIGCDFGDNPLTPAVDVFACNSKLVGGHPFLDTYNEIVGGEVYPDSARDSDGHGTHTASTSAGDIVSSAPIFGIERGPISGVAPGAWVVSYKVCGAEGCFGSDSAAAVEAAILDGVDVINFSISGGSDPFSDPVELAFLDAYAADVFVAASAGNSGPGASTADHLSPWVTTVAASTQTREFGSTLTLTSSDGPDLDLDGVSIGTGIDTSLPVVPADEVAGYTDPGCLEEPPAANTFDGLIVACERGPGRVARGHNVFLGGGEAMVLYNPTLADTETDNHFLPVIHLADGAELLEYLAANSDVEGTFTPGEAREGQGDVIAAFSSRGPGGRFLKPDVTAPGVQILAGHTPTPDAIPLGPAGEYFQAIAGTSMSSPHVAGAAILLDAAHPTWTPGQIKSALMTTAITDVVKEDLTTPADPFDMGSGRINVANAVNPGLTIADDAGQFFALSGNPLTAIHVNVPSINAPVMPGRVTTTRVVENVGSNAAIYDATPVSPPGSTITVTPSHFSIAAGATRTLTVTISVDGLEGQQFGSIGLTAPGRQPLHLPVAFVPGQGDVSLASDCSPDDIEVGSTPTTCTVTATNEGFAEAPAEITTSVDEHLQITDASSGDFDEGSASLETTLAGRVPGVPSLEEFGPIGGPAGYLPLEVFGVTPIPVGDEEALDFNTAPFTYNGVTYTSLSVVSNGYVVVGGPATSEDIQFTPQELPDSAPPNDVLAPFWTDLTGDGDEDPAPDGIRVAELTDGFNVWTVIEFQLNAFGTDDLHAFEIWIGHNGVQDITFNYDPSNHSLDGVAGGLTVGAENQPGTGGDQLDEAIEDDTLPDVDLAVVSTDPEPGDSVSLTVDAEGTTAGTGVVRSELVSSVVPGVTIVDSEVSVYLPAAEVEAFVTQAFNDFLGRDPTASRLAFWTGEIASGGPRTELLDALVDGDEYRSRVVGRVFRDLINRNPTANERATWINQLRAGGLAESRLIAFVGGSNAFKVLAGGTTTGFVNRIHQELLGRNPTPARRAFWVNEINSGTPRSELARLMYQSKESRDRRVRAIYAQLLDRAPATFALNARAEVLLSQPDGAVGVILAASDEYYLKAQ